MQVNYTTKFTTSSKMFVRSSQLLCKGARNFSRLNDTAKTAVEKVDF